MKNNIPDYKEFKKRVLLAMAGKPGTLYPLTAGIMALSGAWALEISAGMPIFAGIALILMGVGSFLTSLLGQPGGLEEKVIKSMNEKSAKVREGMLDDLDQRLAGDGDPRTEKSLRDLRTLFSALAGHLDSAGTRTNETMIHGAPAADTRTVDTRTADFTTLLGIMETAEKIFQTSVGALEKSLELWKKATVLTTGEAKKPILDLRERLIVNVEAGVSRLGQALAKVEAGEVENSAGKLEGLGRELDETLEMAKRVEKRMKDFMNIGTECKTAGQEASCSEH